MKNKIIIKVVLLIVFLILLYIPSVHAAGATLSPSTTTAKPGDTVEVFVDLAVESIGYDLNVSLNNDSLISSAERTKSLSEMDANKTNKISLIQVVSAENRITYSVGTRIATIKYKIADDATAGSNLIVNVKGNIAGKNSSEKNTMDESVTINIVKGENDQSNDQPNNQPDDQPSENNGNNGSNGEQPNNNDGNKENQEDINKDKSNEEKLDTNSKDDTLSRNELPDTGISKVIIIGITILVVIGLINIIKIKKYKEIK